MAAVELKLEFKNPFMAWRSNVKVRYSGADTPSGFGIATAFTADEASDGKIKLWKRKLEGGGSELVGKYETIEEATKVANSLIGEMPVVY